MEKKTSGSSPLQRCLSCFKFACILVWSGFFLFVAIVGVYRVIISGNRMLTATEYECHVVSAELTTCRNNRAGYNLSLEVNDTQCGIFIKEICPIEKVIKENTTIPCYASSGDDDCYFDIDEPSLDSLSLTISLLTSIFAVCLLVVFQDAREQEKRKQQQQPESTSIDDNDQSTNPLDANNVTVQDQDGNTILNEDTSGHAGLITSSEPFSKTSS
eukprot:TRINITY_DN2240_c1_g1_i1.p1 TRINITY_DN2240_c1_g1~~TRINITY_DN2240_c1_g1_i1.p1  ORF type:complete len:215 (+),score=39.78 TRINITY_DN2240_c1_g1_i1:53-697(+)